MNKKIIAFLEKLDYDNLKSDDYESLFLNCSDLVGVWLDKVVDRIPDEYLLYFPRDCSDSVEIWFDKVIDRIPNGNLWCFPIYCASSVEIWGKHPRLKKLLKG